MQTRLYGAGLGAGLILLLILCLGGGVWAGDRSRGRARDVAECEERKWHLSADCGEATREVLAPPPTPEPPKVGSSEPSPSAASDQGGSAGLSFPVGGPTQIAAGGEVTMAVDGQGQLWAWGANAGGCVRDGATTDRAYPVPVAGMAGLAQVSPNRHHTVALGSDGMVWTWGDNVAGELGPHIKLNECQMSPQRVAGLSHITAVASGEFHSLALQSDGTVWAWGSNKFGQLGRGPTDGMYAPPQHKCDFRAGPIFQPPFPTPERVSGLVGAIQIDAGAAYSVALTSDGKVWTWGLDVAAMKGNDPPVYSTTPVLVEGLDQVLRIDAGTSHTLALRKDGTVWAWGNNRFGGVGDRTTTLQPNPVQVQGLDGVIAVAAGLQFSLALKEDGTVWAWGANSETQLGDGTNQHQTTPVRVQGLSGITHIAAGGEHALAISRDQTLWAWGSDSNGQLGDGVPSKFYPTPQPVPGLTDIVAVASGVLTSVALSSDGSVYTWGSNWEDGRLGLGNIGNIWALPTRVPTLEGVVGIAAGEAHTLALRSDGTVWAWGKNQRGELGDGTTLSRNIPVQVQGPTNVVRVAAHGQHSLALTAEGVLWTWGKSYRGKGWDGDTSDQSWPVRVKGLEGATAIWAGDVGWIAVKADGTVWVKGAKPFLGIKGVADTHFRRLDESEVERLVAAVGAVGNFLLLKSGAGVWGWGFNSWSVAGEGTSPHRLTLTHLKGLDNVVEAYAAGATLAVTADGRVWGWGSNRWGLLGDGSTTDRADPVPVQLRLPVLGPGVDPHHQRIALWYHALAVLRDGSVVIWGDCGAYKSGLETLWTPRVVTWGPR